MHAQGSAWPCISAFGSLLAAALSLPRMELPRARSDPPRSSEFACVNVVLPRSVRAATWQRLLPRAAFVYLTALSAAQSTMAAHAS
jgi:hypothetical protein